MPLVITSDGAVIVADAVVAPQNGPAVPLTPPLFASDDLDAHTEVAADEICLGVRR